MYSGKIMEKGNCADVFYNQKHPYTWALLNAAPNLELENKQTLVAIEGTPPDLIDPPAGCPFAARCPHCMQICTEEFPPEYEFGEGHVASCWMRHPDSGYADMSFGEEA